MGAEGGKMTFLEHLEELRRRLIYCIIAVVGGIAVCWIFREEIRAFLEAPLYDAWARVEGLPPPQALSYTSLVEPFMVYFKLAAIGGVFLAVPVILYNLWKFVSPGLYARERRIALPFVFVSSLLFLGGSTLAYSFVFPIGIQFFLEFAAGGTTEKLEAQVAIAAGAEEGAEPGDAGAPEPFERRGAAAAARAPVPAAPGDAGVGEGPDAGVETAGVVDAGPEAIAAPTVSPQRPPPLPAEPPAPKADRVEAPSPSFFDLIMEKLLRSGCGGLVATDDGRGAASLRFTWHEAECGPKPVPKGLARDGEPVAVAWREAAEVPVGYDALIARDVVPRAGPHEYELTTLAVGEDARKLAPVLMLSDYLSFAIKLLFAFGVVFELPILVVFLSLAGIVNHKTLLRFSRWFIILALVVAAILTPPDALSQLMLGGPLIALYFISIVIAYFIDRSRRAG